MGNMGGHKMILTWTVTLFLLVMLYPFGQPCATRLPKPNWILISDMELFIEENGADTESYLSYSPSQQSFAQLGERKTTDKNLKASTSDDATGVTPTRNNGKRTSLTGTQTGIAGDALESSKTSSASKPLGEESGGQFAVKTSLPTAGSYAKNQGSVTSNDSEEFSNTQQRAKGTKEVETQGKIRNSANTGTSTISQDLPSGGKPFADKTSLPTAGSYAKSKDSTTGSDKEKFSTTQQINGTTKAVETQGPIDPFANIWPSTFFPELPPAGKPVADKNSLPTAGSNAKSEKVSSTQQIEKGTTEVETPGKIGNNANTGISTQGLSSGVKPVADKTSLATAGSNAKSEKVSSTQQIEKGTTEVETPGKIGNNANTGTSIQELSSGVKPVADKTSLATAGSNAKSEKVSSTQQIEKGTTEVETPGKIGNNTNRGTSTQELSSGVKPVADKTSLATAGSNAKSEKFSSTQQINGTKAVETQGQIDPFANIWPSTFFPELPTAGKPVADKTSLPIAGSFAKSQASTTGSNSEIFSNTQQRAKEVETQGKIGSNTNTRTSTISQEFPSGGKPIAEKTSLATAGSNAKSKDSTTGSNSEIFSNTQQRAKGTKEVETQGKIGSNANMGTSTISQEFPSGGKPIAEKTSLSTAGSNAKSKDSTSGSQNDFSSKLQRAKGTKEVETIGKIKTNSNTGTSTIFQELPPTRKTIADKTSLSTNAKSKASITGSDNEKFSSTLQKAKGTKEVETIGKMGINSNTGTSTRSQELPLARKTIADKTSLPTAGSNAKSKGSITGSDNEKFSSTLQKSKVTKEVETIGKMGTNSNTSTKSKEIPPAGKPVADKPLATASSNAKSEKSSSTQQIGNGTKEVETQGKIGTFASPWASIFMTEFPPAKKPVVDKTSPLPTAGTNAKSNGSTTGSVSEIFTGSTGNNIGSNTGGEKSKTQLGRKDTTVGGKDTTVGGKDTAVGGKDTTVGGKEKIGTSTNLGTNPAISQKLPSGGKPVGDTTSPPTKTIKSKTGSSGSNANFNTGSDRKDTKEGGRQRMIETYVNLTTAATISKKLASEGKPVGDTTEQPMKVTNGESGSTDKNPDLKPESNVSNTELKEEDIKEGGEGKIEDDTNMGTSSVYQEFSPGGKPGDDKDSPSARLAKPEEGSRSNAQHTEPDQEVVSDASSISQYDQTLPEYSEELASDEWGPLLFEAFQATKKKKTSFRSESTSGSAGSGLNFESEDSPNRLRGVSAVQPVAPVKPVQMVLGGNEVKTGTSSDLGTSSGITDDVVISSRQSKQRSWKSRLRNEEEEEEEDDVRLALDSVKLVAVTLD